MNGVSPVKIGIYAFRECAVHQKVNLNAVRHVDRRETTRVLFGVPIV
jgi:hypothetical protein